MRKNFNKRVRMDAVCASDCGLHKEYSLIYFIGEYVYATNGYALVRNKISEISNFTSEEIELLDGRCLHYRDYKNILNYEMVDITEDGFVCHSGDGSDALFYYSVVKANNIKKQFDYLIRSTIESKSIGINEVGFNFGYIEKIRRALYGGEKCIIDFKENKMLIRSIDKSTGGVALLMCIDLRNYQ